MSPIAGCWIATTARAEATGVEDGWRLGHWEVCVGRHGTAGRESRRRAARDAAPSRASATAALTFCKAEATVGLPGGERGPGTIG